MSKESNTTKIQAFIAIFFLVFVVLAVINSYMQQTSKQLTIDEALKLVQDEQLRSCIETYANKHEYKYTDHLNILECHTVSDEKETEAAITNMEGLENFRYLKRLNLSNSEISSLAPLRELKDLEYLNLENSNIYVVTDISGLYKLKELNLYGNSISSASRLGSLHNLTSLNLGKNKINDLSFVSELKSLRELNLRSNAITKLNFKLPKELKILNLGNNSISELNALHPPNNLRELYLPNNQIQELGVLKDLRQLKVLDLNKNLIEDISPLNRLRLSRLNLQSNPIKYGLDKIYINLTAADKDLDSVIDLSSNTHILCKDLSALKARIDGYEGINVIEPKSCDNGNQRRYRARRKKGIFLFFKRLF